MSTYDDLLKKILSDVSRFEDFSPENITAKRVKSFVKKCKSLIKSSDSSPLLQLKNPDLRLPENFRKLARQWIRCLSKDATWLDVETKQSLNDFLAEYPALISVGDYRFSSDFFTHRCNDQWKSNLSEFKGRPNLHFLEIGSYEGRASVWLLENILTHASCRLTCVDPFAPEYSNLFDHNIENTGVAYKVDKISAFSSDALRMMKDRHFDYAYLDGDHRKEFVLEDAILLWPMLKLNGIVTFDDYGCSDVRMAVDAFLSVYAEHFAVIDSGYQMTLRKTGEVSPMVSEFYTIY